MSAELLRQWKTTRTGMGADSFNQVTSEYIDRLTGVGYGRSWRENILRAALVGYMRILQKTSSGETAMNRKGASTFKKRRFQKPVGYAEWFRLDGWEDDDHIEVTYLEDRVV